MVCSHQEEAALRLTQLNSGASDYRAMSIELQYYCQTHRLFTVPKLEFTPVPKVNGLVVDFALYPPEERAVADATGFLAMVSKGTASACCMLSLQLTGCNVSLRSQSQTYMMCSDCLVCSATAAQLRAFATTYSSAAAGTTLY